MELSPPDLNGLGSGLLAIIIILLIINIILILLNVDAMVIGTAVGRWAVIVSVSAVVSSYDEQGAVSVSVEPNNSL